MSNKHHNAKPPAAPPAVAPNPEATVAPLTVAEQEQALLLQRADEEAKEAPDKAVLDEIEAKLEALPKDDEPKAEPDKVVDNVGAAPPAVAPANNGKVAIDEVAGDLADYKTVVEHNLLPELIRECQVELAADGRILVANLAEASDLLRGFLDKERQKEHEPHVTTTLRNIIRSKESQNIGIAATAPVGAPDEGEDNQTGLYNGEKYPRYTRALGHGNWDWGVKEDGTPIKVSLHPPDREHLK